MQQIISLQPISNASMLNQVAELSKHIAVAVQAIVLTASLKALYHCEKN